MNNRLTAKANNVAKNMIGAGESVGAVANMLHHEFGIEWYAAKALAQTFHPRPKQKAVDLLTFS